MMEKVSEFLRKEKELLSPGQLIIILWGLILFSSLLYLALVNLNAINGWKPVLTFWIMMSILFLFYFLGYHLSRRIESKKALTSILVGGMLFRVILLPAGLPYDTSIEEKIVLMGKDLKSEEVIFERFQLFDSDVWRYLWDGHVSNHGINPYCYAPWEEDLDDLAGSGDTYLWSDIRENINYPLVPTVYPPLAQWIFLGSHWLAPGSIIVIKLILILCEVLAVIFLVGTLKKLALPLNSIILYAWNPLVIKVIVGSSHMDAILVACVSAMIYFITTNRPGFTVLSFSMAILAKLSPVILFPFLLKRISWKYLVAIPIIIGLSYFPYLDAGPRLFEGFLTFSSTWQFNAGLFDLIQWPVSLISEHPAEIAKVISSMLLIGCITYLFMKDDKSTTAFMQAGSLSLGALFLLSPTVMPWYITWILPFAMLSRQYVWFLLSFLLLIAFHIMIDQVEYIWPKWLEFGIFFLAIVISKTNGLAYAKKLKTSDFSSR